MSLEMVAQELAFLRQMVQKQAEAISMLSRAMGTRLSRQQMCERYGICSKTLTARVRAGELPTPGVDGKWLLDEVVEWDTQRITLRAQAGRDR